ncbi:protein MMS22-like [Microcaecilia unicolor]|uniref:Protein MMS22-like n=1 Tax=Microcaecilia unicolor TaxID=1415580 RepID=A0A6P7XUC2_9AMPH|nr:protein MMS22-like [Microcaecilia unicolor]XP_030054265.1 protein MMS22-like [Microcaecilia unicolor]
MTDDFSGSLTPPVSPYLTPSLEIEDREDCIRPPYFSCAADYRNGGKAFSSESYLGSGSVKRLLLRLDPSPTDYETDTVEMFGFQWVTEIALVESTRLLFGLLRQQIYKLEKLAQANSCDFGQAASIHHEAEDIRQQCIEFLHYVKVFIFRYLEPQKSLDDKPLHPYEEHEAQLPSVLVEELYALTLYIGHLCELPSNILRAFTMQNQGKVFPPSWHLIHLHLDIHWSVLEILHILGEKMLGQVVYAHQFVNITGENLTNISLLENHCGNLICDLISLSVIRYTKVRPSEALSSPPFSCTCIKELWTLLIQLLDHRHKGCDTESFWSWLNKILNGLLQGTGSIEGINVCEVVQCKDTLGFCWWIITHLALLYHFDRNGNLEEKKQMGANWSFVEKLLKKCTHTQDGILEDQLRMHLQCCLIQCGIWDTNLSVVTILWEYYSKCLNSSFNIPWLGLKGLVNVSKTPFSMLEVVKKLCSDSQTTDLYESESSYHIFLRIFAHLMMKGKESSGTHPWKQIKGRIYSKFHQRRMQELSVVGLQNFFSLFLMLASLTEPEDITSRVLDLLDFLSPASISTAQRALIWQGYFAFLLTYVEKNMDISVLAEKLSHGFRETAKEFLVMKHDYTQKQALWTLLSTYIDGAQEVFETSCYLHLSEEKLLNDGFSMLLPACQHSELGTVLHFLQTALARLRDVHKGSSQGHRSGTSDLHVPPLYVAKEHHQAIASALWKNFFPYLKSLRLSQTPPPELADATAGFTLLAVDMLGTAPSDLQPHPVLTMMQLFGWDDMVCTQLVSRYLGYLLHNSELSETLSGPGYASYQALSVRSWFRCVLQIFVDRPAEIFARTESEKSVGKTHMKHLGELTRLIFKLPEVESILSKAQVEPSSYKQDPKSALVQFIKATGKVYSGLHMLPEKSAMVSKTLEYLGDVIKYIKPYFKKKGPPEGLQLAYSVIGCLMKHWALILATSKAQQLLFRIIDFLLLPHALFQQDKALPTAMLSAIRESLPLFLQGLCAICCQSQAQGAYVKQQLRNIIQQYFGRFLPASPSSVPSIANNPILQALCDSTNSPHISYLRKAFVQVLSENYLQFKGQAPPARLASVLSFLLHVFQRTKNTDTFDVELLLPSVLKCLVLVNEPQVRKLSTEILQHVVENCRMAPEESAAQLASVLRDFVQEYSTIYDHQVYNILTTLTGIDQSLVVSLIPTITQSLKNSEHKQGLGRNTVQREAYRRLLSHLGESGQSEILKLEIDES